MENPRATVIDEECTGVTAHQTGGRATAESSFVETALAIHDELAQLALNGAGFSQLAAAFSRLVGNPVLIENRFFKTLAYASPNGVPPRDERPPSLRALRKGAAVQALWSRLQGERKPVLLSAAGERETFPPRAVAPVVVSDDVVGYVSIIEREQPLCQTALPLVRQAALATGLEFVRHQAAIEAELRFKGDALDFVIQSADVLPEVRAARSALLAYDCNALQTLILLAPHGCPDGLPPTDSLPTLHDLATLAAAWAGRVVRGSLVAERDGQIVVLLAGEPLRHRTRARAPSEAGSTPHRSTNGSESALSAVQAYLTGELRREVDAYFPGLTISIAITPPVRDSRELHQAYTVARRALSIVDLLGKSGQDISTNDPRLAVFLLFDSTKPDTRREFVDLVLGPLILYDQRGHRALVETLEAYLTCGGNLETTARTLGVHTSTLKYRLQRIAEVSGLDVRNADHRFNAALALRLRTLTGD